MTESGVYGRVVVMMSTVSTVSMRSGAALSIHHFRVEDVVFRQVDEVLLGRRFGRELLEIGEERLDARRFHAAEEGERAVGLTALAAIQLHETFEGIERPARRHGRDMPPERGDSVLHAPADHHEVVRRGLAADLAQAALEADARDVMLAAP